MERIVAVWPETGFLPIDIHMCLTHGSIENQGCFFLGVCIEVRTIPAYTDVRQSAGTAGFYRGLCLQILCNGYILQVVIPVKRSEDSPIVRNTD